MSDVVVIGAGVIGCAVSRALAQAGVPTTLLDSEQPGAASRAAAGMLSPLAEAGRAGVFARLAEASLERYPAFVQAIEAESGIAVEYQQTGKLHVALRDADDAVLAGLAAAPSAQRFGVVALAAAAARELEPALTADVRRAVLVKRDHCVDSRRLHAALRLAAERAGVRVRSETAAQALEAHDGSITVRLAHGGSIVTGAVVIAAGAWSGALEGAAIPPVRPIRGQMLAVLGSEALLGRVVETPRCYLIPRRDGRLLIGATVEDCGFLDGVTEAGIAELLDAAAEVVPEVRKLPVIERWFGYRPATPDLLPVLGPDPRVPGVFHATGHYRNGILLAPITAEWLAASVRGLEPPLPPEEFSAARFRI